MMSRYQLHARLLEGPLSAPTRNELQSRASDSLDDMLSVAEELVACGMSVWVYRHDATSGHGQGAYRVVAEWNTRGEKVR